MSSFASFEQFIRHGGQASIVLSFRAAEAVLELKRARLDGAIVDAFEYRRHELSVENWFEISASFARAGIEIDRAAQEVSAEIERFPGEFSEQAATLADADAEAVADADIASLAELTDGFKAHRVIRDRMAFSNTARPRTALERRTPREAYRAGRDQKSAA